MNKQIKVSLRFTALATLGLGIIFPLLVTSVGLLIPSARPSVPTKPFQKEDLFRGRPSMSGRLYSGASNLSLTNPELWKQVEERLNQISQYPPKGTSDSTLVPRDLLFASASGYDPHISVRAALYQIPRIAQVRHMDASILKRLVEQHTQPKLWGFIGTEKINVAELNESLKRLDVGLKASPEPGMFHKER